MQRGDSLFGGPNRKARPKRRDLLPEPRKEYEWSEHVGSSSDELEEPSKFMSRTQRAKDSDWRDAGKARAEFEEPRKKKHTEFSKSNRSILYRNIFVDAASKTPGDPDVSAWMNYYVRKTKNDGADIEIPEPVAVKEEMVDEEKFEFAARKPEKAEPSRRAEAASTRVVGWDGEPAVPDNPTRDVVDWDEIASSSSSSDTDPDDEDYKVGDCSEESIGSFSDEELEAEEGDAAAKEGDVIGEGRCFKRLRKASSHTLKSVDVQDPILGTSLGNGNPQGKAVINGTPEEASSTEASSDNDEDYRFRRPSSEESLVSLPDHILGAIFVNGNAMIAEESAEAESTPVEERAEEGTAATDGIPREEECAAADDTPGDENDENGKASTGVRISVSMAAEGKSRGTKRPKPSDVTRESRMRKRGEPEPGSTKRSRKSQGKLSVENGSGFVKRRKRNSCPDTSIGNQIPPNAHPESSSSDHEPSTDQNAHPEQENDKVDGMDTISVPKEKKKFVTVLINSIIGGGNIAEEEEEAQQEPLVEPSSWNGPTLPKKFRFEDEDPEPVVVSEHDLMVERLFEESGMNEGLLGHEDEPSQQEETKEEETPEEEELSCQHEFYIQEPIGRICRLCFYIETEMKYIDPPFAPHPFRLQRSSDREKITQLKGVEFSPEKGDRLGDAFSADKGTVWDAIPGAKSHMYEHQQEGFEFMWKNLEGTINLGELKNSEDNDKGGCIISHAPGTGKTLLTLMFINAYLKIFPNSRPMIIAPASMLLTWEEEFKKWNMDFPFHNLNQYELTGKERKILNYGRAMDKDVNRLIKIYSWTKERSVLGISYNLFENLVGQCSEKYKRMLLEMPRLVIMDEGHTPRNSRSSIWNKVLELQTKRKIILTGTPFQNNFLELFNTLHLVRPETADSLLKEETCAPMLAMKRGRKKKKRQVETLEKEPGVEKAIEKLKDSISPFVHVHKGHILKRSLPGLKDSVLLLKPPPLQKQLINLIEASPHKASSFLHEYRVALLSTHPSLAEHCTLKSRQKAAIDMKQVVNSKGDYKEGVKTRFVIELVRVSIAKKEKVLVFSQYQQIHNLLAEQLRAFFNWKEGRQVIQMHGKQDQKLRQQLITKFNDPKSEAVVLLASTKCCSEGISLVGASRVVLLDVVWNPSVERQAISRAYRLGQQKVVHTFFFFFFF